MQVPTHPKKRSLFLKRHERPLNAGTIPRWGRKQCKHKGLLPLPHFQPEPSLELATASIEIFKTIIIVLFPLDEVWIRIKRNFCYYLILRHFNCSLKINIKVESKKHHKNKADQSNEFGSHNL
jgi:hypothetical protein